MIFVILLSLLSLAFAQFDISIGVDQDLVLNITFSNPLNYEQTFLMWGTPFEGVWTDMFDIRDEQDNRMDYIGMMVRRGETPISEEYLTLPAGGFITTTIDLGDNYQFLTTGNYVVRLDLPVFDDIYAVKTSTTGTHYATFTVDDLPNKKEFKPQGFTNCNANQISQTNAAISGSISESARAFNCLNGNGCDSLSTRWFGTYSQSNWNFVTVAYRNINSRLNGAEFNGYCNPAGCGSNVYGYVYPTDSTFTVYLCGLFWSRANERVNTIVHEMSHFRTLAGTQDYTYGQSNCLALARSNPNQASRNADNICYFSAEA